MGWFKKLKKKLSINNVLKAAKTVTQFIPGGNLINAGLKVFDSARQAASKELSKGSKQPASTAQLATAEQAEMALQAGKSDNKKWLLYGGIAIAAYFLFMKK